jgi:uncharacterized protein (UPF0548 family)
MAAQRGLPFSYTEVGATRHLDEPESDAVRGDFNVDRSRENLGRGHNTFYRAKEALRDWKMFEQQWVQVCWPDTPQCAGCAVGVLAHIGQGWILNAARIVYALEESGPIERIGFAYGTLPGHAMRGEERFVIEWNRQSDQVYFDIAALSKPNQILSWASYPLVRRLQTRFRRGAIAAMRRAIEQ